ncbi:MAG TPA: glycosyltransferase [Geminicoccus sp.]|uniref:glycosyltransferase n=1 Tax=Geminicoccus sp. TaxID=2024832 RepID=UPI002CB40B15|nr:glycosyltransferase [Geminicoccus sp.]HWL70931.1 glycosyltransferase [Geminicoccus sp.]
MRIGLRVLSNPLWTGGIHYVLAWATALSRLPAIERPEVVLLVADERGQPIAEANRHLAAAVEPFDRAANLDLDLVYSATQLFEAPIGAPWAGWIPDWQCRYLPELFDQAEYARRDLHFRLLATRTPALAVSSAMAEADTRRIVGDAMVPTVRLPFPALVDPAEVAALPRAEEAPERYLLICNQWWRHKNLELPVEALARCRDRTARLVFTGETKDPRWPDNEARIRGLIERHGLAGRCHVLGRIPRITQLALLRDCVAVIQPSRFEGWSSVVEEAKVLHRPLLLAEFPVHREQAPDARFFGADDPDALAQAMDDAWAGRIEPVPFDAEANVLACARRLVDLAGITRQRYDPQRHDPAVLLPEFERELDRLAADPAMADLVQRQRGAVHALRRRVAAVAADRPVPVAAAPSVLGRLKGWLSGRR